MRPLKKLALSMNASFDNLVNHLENHEAIANCAIEEIQAAASKISVQLKRVQTDASNLRIHCDRLSKEHDAWAERARKVHSSDPDISRECVRRMKRLKTEQESIAQQLSETVIVERKLSQDLEKVEQRLNELKRRRHLLLSRDTQASALATGQDNGQILNDIDQIFERWEINVLRKEYKDSANRAPEDELELQFAQQEERDELDKALEELLQNNPSNP